MIIRAEVALAPARRADARRVMERQGSINPERRVRNNIVPIAKGYSRASQYFLFAHLTRAKHDFVPRH
jgi:hypothetical protein